MLTYGDYQVDESKFPGLVTTRLLTRAISHILSNECSAAIGGKIKAEIVKGSDRKADSVTKDELAAYREANDSVVTGWEDAWRKAKIEAMYDGTLSVRQSAGPRLDPVDRAMRQIAKDQVTATLKANGVKFPKDGEVFTDANGQEFTGDELIERRIANPKFAEAIKTLAERKVREAERLRKQVAAGAGEAGLSDL